MTSAIIVAAGKGTRMGGQVDKLFIEIHGCPVVGHTWRSLDRASPVDEIILVVRSGMQSQFVELAKLLAVKKPFRLVTGGLERQDSVWNGLESVSAQTAVAAIHDAARPCTSEKAIADTIEAARRTGAAVTAQPVTDTIKESTDGQTVLRTLDRTRLWAVQTPQCFRVDIIRKALSEVRRRGLIVTDDTAACELIGQPVQLVPTSAPNPKLTRPEDVPILEALLTRVVSS